MMMMVKKKRELERRHLRSGNKTPSPPPMIDGDDACFVYSCEEWAAEGSLEEEKGKNETENPQNKVTKGKDVESLAIVLFCLSFFFDFFFLCENPLDND